MHVQEIPKEQEKEVVAIDVDDSDDDKIPTLSELLLDNDLVTYGRQQLESIFPQAMPLLDNFGVSSFFKDISDGLRNFEQEIEKIMDKAQELAEESTPVPSPAPGPSRSKESSEGSDKKSKKGEKKKNFAWELLKSKSKPSKSNKKK